MGKSKAEVSGGKKAQARITFYATPEYKQRLEAAALLLHKQRLAVWFKGRCEELLREFGQRFKE